VTGPTYWQLIMGSVVLAQRLFDGPESAEPLVLLHGLLGSSRNWQTAGKQLAGKRRVYALDLRNHGDSPHNSRMDYPSMAADVLDWAAGAGLEHVHMLGHSMGGKVAMYLACRYPDRFKSLAVVDIAPRAYPPRWEKEFSLMRRMPVEHFTRRSEAEEWLEPEIRDWAFRKFLISNLERDPAGGYRWVVNLGILESALPNLFQQVPETGQQYDGPCLFVRGGKSRFVEDGDFPMIRRFFPKVRIETVSDAGHNVHFDQTAAFVEVVNDFLSQST
jgi:pimeloyl-ACP methyl ester carboxylesterase